MKNNWIECEIPIKDIELLMSTHEIIVDSPDGFVKVTNFIHKPHKPEYILKIKDKIVRCSGKHLWETSSGWKFTEDICDGNSHIFITNRGLQPGIIEFTGNIIPIVDITVDHPNHRYYTNGISSHNTGSGKSAFMCHLAASTMRQGLNVLYITMEMAEQKISERIDANMMKVNMNDIEHFDKDHYMSKIEKIKAKSIGKLIVKEYPTSAVHAGHFRALLEELKTKKNFKPALIIIDYINICCSSRVKMSASINTNTYIKSISEELRGLACEYDVPMFTATQTNRGGFCLDLSTIVNTENGEKLLKDIKIGDKLESNIGFNEVIKIYPIAKKRMFKITTESGKIIICSEDHLFPTSNGELNIRSGLKINSILLTLN